MNTSDIAKYSKNIFNIAIIIVALLVANKIYTSQTKNVEVLKQQMDMEAKKNNIINEISQSEKTVDSYRRILSKRDASLTINTISNIANGLNIKIISINPQQEKRYPVYVKYPFNLTVSTNNYHAIGKLVSQLESCEDIYIIVDNVAMKPENITQLNTDPFSYKIAADLQISSIALEN